MKACIIVGSGPGVGEAIARRFGGEGYAIGLIARTAKKLESQQARLGELGIRVSWSVADAGNATELTDAINDLIKTLDGCDVMIYNAAVLRPADPLELSGNKIAEEFAVNVLGAHQAAKLVAPEMIKNGGGAILFTGGGLALEAFPEWTSLALGKAALRSLAISLYKTLSPKGVHVSVLAICGIVKPGGAFDPDLIAAEYWRVATSPKGVEDREVIFQPEGTNPFYNDPNGLHQDTSLLPHHCQPK